MHYHWIRFARLKARFLVFVYVYEYLHYPFGYRFLSVIFNTSALGIKYLHFDDAPFGIANTRVARGITSSKYNDRVEQCAEAVRFLRDHRREPFVLCVNFLEPHMPFTGPRDNQYDPASVLLPCNFNNPPTEDQPRKARLRWQRYYERGRGGGPLKTEDDWRRLIARYWGLCSLVDAHVGTILSGLDELGLDENTIVVFTSDHGDMMGSHGLVGKGVMYEESVTMPLLVRLPGPA
jgi:arylsulfatase A-like enzyme